MIPKERDKQVPAQGGQANGHANGHSLSRIEPAEGGVVLAFAGELDIAAADDFTDRVRALVSGEKGEVIISFENCGFIDSVGLRTLIMLAQELRAQGQTLVVCGLRDGPRRIFEITGLDNGPDFEVREAA